MTEITVGPAEIRAGKGGTVLLCRGLGSCVCLALWDPVAQVGGMGHIVLPDSRRHQGHASPGMFADLAAEALLLALRDLGARPARIVAKLAGGATIFSAAAGGGSMLLEIGPRNAEAAMRAVRSLGLPIVGTDVGGAAGRAVEFSLLEGTLTVRTAGGKARTL